VRDDEAEEELSEEETAGTRDSTADQRADYSFCLSHLYETVKHSLSIHPVDRPQQWLAAGLLMSV